MAKAVAGLWQMPLLRLDVAAVFQSGGSQEESLRETVRVAESLAPVVLWIDEIEKGFLMGGDKGGGGQAFGYFLTWMQEKSKPVFVVATANEVRILPPELLRKGRFDEIFFVDLPNAHERLSVLEIQLRRRGRDPDRFDLTGIVEETERFSGAELEQLVVAALYAAFAASRELEQDDLLDAAREMIPLAVTMDDHLKDLREWARPRARPASMDRRRIDFFSEWEAP
jgi:SpoVK/Ycf46/Vps4 family AAA+-type ATPase